MSTLRSDMLRIASGLPQGDATRRDILATLRAAAPDYDWWDRNGRKFKTKTTRAIKLVQKDPKKALQMAEELFEDMEAHGYPDNWHRVNVLKEDAEQELRRKSDRWASDKEAGSDAVLWQIIDQRGFYKLYNEMEDANDDSSASMLREISDKLAKSLELSGNEQQALSRLRRCVDAQGKWDPALQRNNIFKAANLLGIKLPHGMF
jgi:Txe/YoeB family toxin of Txe-Axe toxin-antitoxin module